MSATYESIYLYVNMQLYTYCCHFGFLLKVGNSVWIFNFRIRELTSHKIGTLLRISGQVVRTHPVHPELVSGTFVCADCQTLIKDVEQQFKYTQVCYENVFGVFIYQNQHLVQLYADFTRLEAGNVQLIMKQ